MKTPEQNLPPRVERKVVRLEPGEYRAQIGFREFGKFESQWFSAASDDTALQDKSFIIDKSHKEVQQFSKQLFQGLTSTPEDQEFVDELDSRFSQLIPSAPLSEREHYEKLSDIVRSGTGTCAAKTLLLGVLLKEKYPNLLVQEIYGTAAVVHDRIPYPFSHVWLRGESGKYVFLYDAMYSKTAVFEKKPEGLYPVDGRVDTFEKYSVEAFPVSRMNDQLKMSMVGGLHVVQSYDQQSHKLYVNPSESLNAQADGAIYFEFSLKNPGEMETFNNSVRSSHPGGASVYCPVVSLQSR